MTTTTSKIRTEYLMILLLQLSYPTNGFCPISWKLNCQRQQQQHPQNDLTYVHGRTRLTYCQVLADPTILDTTTTTNMQQQRRRRQQQQRSFDSSNISKRKDNEIPKLPRHPTISSISSTTKRHPTTTTTTTVPPKKSIMTTRHLDKLSTPLSSTLTMSIPTTNTLMMIQQQQSPKLYTSSPSLSLLSSTYPNEMRSDYPIGNPSIFTTTSSSLHTSRSSTMPGYSVKTKNQVYQEKMKQQHMDTSGWSSFQVPRNTSNENDIPKRKTNKSSSKDSMYQISNNVPDSLVQFAKELHQEARITPNEELELGQLTQEAIHLQSLYDSLEVKLEREPSDEEWCAAAGKINMEAIRQAIEAGTEAKNKLVTSNLRLVQGVVNVYIRNGLSGQYNAGDMMQEGIMALIRAAEKFEPQRGFRFSTYAMYWIRSAVKRSQTFQSRVITIPQRLHANHKRIQLIQRQLRQSLGRPPTNVEWAHAAGISENQLDRCLRAMEQRCYSLDQPIRYSGTSSSSLSSNQDSSLYDVVESMAGSMDGNTRRRKSLPQSLLRESLIETLYRTLDHESAQLLLLRFGLVDPDRLPEGWEGPLTIAQVSQLVGKKPDKVRRQILKSLNDLKCSMGNDWRDFESIVEG